MVLENRQELSESAEECKIDRGSREDKRYVKKNGNINRLLKISTD